MLVVNQYRLKEPRAWNGNGARKFDRIALAAAPGDQRKSSDSQRDQPRIQMRRRGFESLRSCRHNARWEARTCSIASICLEREKGAEPQEDDGPCNDRADVLAKSAGNRG
jgi:hypothetical protein